MAKKNYEVGFVFGAKKAAGFDKAFKSVGASIKGIGTTIAGLAGAYVGVQALASTGKQALESASSMEGYRNTLNVVQKDSQKAAKTMKWAVDFANKTPFETDSIVEATVRLESYGLKAQQVMPTIGDMAGVMNKDILQAVEAVADAQTGELERMKEFGITKAMLVEKAGELYRGAEVVNAKGQITDQAKFNDALFALMDDRFKGGMDIQAGSFKGLMSTVKGIWKTGLASMAGISMEGEIVKDSAFDVVKQNIKGVSQSLQELADNGTFERVGVVIGKGLKAITTGFQWIGEKSAPILSDFGNTVKDFTKSKIEPAMRAMMPFAKDMIAQAKAGAAELYGAVGKLAKGDIQGGSADILGMLGFSGESITAIQGYAQSLGESFGKAATYIQPLFTGFRDGFSKVLPVIQDVVNFAVQKVLPVVQSVVGFLVDTVLPPVVRFFSENLPRVGAIFQNLWGAIKPVLTAVMSYIGILWQVFQPVIGAVVEKITGLASGIMRVLEGITGFISGVFTGNWTAAWQGIVDILGGIWDGVVAIVKAPLNGIIGLINKAIGGINNMGLNVPDWVPIIGGKGFTIPTIPMLATGGIATKATTAIVGEGKESEAILPLSKLQGLLNIQSLLDTGPIAALLDRLLSTQSPIAPDGGGAPITYSPQFVFQGPVSRETADYAAQTSFQKFREFMRQYEADRKRKGLDKN